MEKTKLISEIFLKKTDIEKKELLKKYGNIKLYRYRCYNGKEQEYEFNTLRNRKVWLSRFDMLDDCYEGLFTKSSENDIDTILKLVRDLLGDARVLSRMEKRRIQRCPEKLMKEVNNGLCDYRRKLVMSCFSENSPIDQGSNMWKQYCLDRKNKKVSGFCLEYNLFDILDQGEIICPVYYESNISITDLYNKFNGNIQVIFMHKEEKGYDSKNDPDNKNIISWKEQNEWRIVKENSNFSAKGRETEKELIPSKVYYLDSMPDEQEFLEILNMSGQHIEVEKINIDSIR